MKIYYVSKTCKVKGPAFLRLAGEDYMEEGDICIVSTDGNTIAYLLTNEQRSWSQCKTIAKVTINIDVDWSNFLLYSYNGFNGRKGDISALEILLSVFNSTVLGPLFEEIIGVLKYHKDHIDTYVIRNIYQKVYEQPVKTEENVALPKTDNPVKSRYFVSFLKSDLLEIIRPLLVHGMSDKEILTMIKSSYPFEFRKAFIEYNRYNPTGSIQEGLSEYFCKQKTTEDIKTQNIISNKNYEEIFRHLNVNKQGGKVPPHKPILLLAVMELVEKGEIVSPFIPISRELEQTFQRIWTQYVPEGEGQSCAMQYPFFYMRSESFWRLELLPWHVEKSSYSLKELRRNFYGAIIDTELFNNFCNIVIRKSLKRILISTYLQDNNSADDNYPSKMEERNSVILNTKELHHDVASEAGYEEHETLAKFRIVDYSDKSIAVYGDTQHLISFFKDIGGYFNAYLKEGPGWVFSKKRRYEVLEVLSNNQINDYSLGISSLSSCKDNSQSNSSSASNSKIPKIYKEWIARLSGMRGRTNNGYPSPHKTIFILTIIEGIKQSIVKNEVIYPLVRLSDLFKKIWNQHVPKDWPYISNFYQPFIHMCGEDFYTLENKSGVKWGQAQKSVDETNQKS